MIVCAQDVSFEVAVKVFSYVRALPPPSVIASFSTELGVMSELSHPNIVSIIGMLPFILHVRRSASLFTHYDLSKCLLVYVHA